MEEIELRDATKEDAAVFAEYRFRMFVDMHPDRDFHGYNGEAPRGGKEARDAQNRPPRFGFRSSNI